MNNPLTQQILKLLGFSLALFGIHYYILIQFFEGNLVIPLWLIYAFNMLAVFIVISVINHQSKNKENNLLNVFMILTVIKMILTLVLLLPLFLKKSDHMMLEVFNFFIAYFVFLAFEIMTINKFLQKS